MFSLTISWLVVLGLRKTRRQAAERNQRASPRTLKLLTSESIARESVDSTFDEEKAYHPAEIMNHNQNIITRPERQVVPSTPMQLPLPAHTRTRRTI
ncbi:hypothetical protein V5O48_012738 [Marasmius crinis-equi]|uniref:Secreted protein n=1 Tax=Marasmius crinis-equi TaxID=585013 RepID=A0ABR3F216_9AGAR